MDAALGWVGQIASWFGGFIPTWERVRITEGCVKFLPGGKTQVLKAGIHWYWPAFTEMEVVPVVRQVLDTAAQTLMTKDNRAVYVAGIVVYDVVDLHKFVVENFDATDSLDDIVQTAIRKVIVSRTFAQIQEARADVDNKLKSDVQKVLESFGIRVEAARLTDFSTARVLNLVGDGIGNVNIG